MTISFGTPKWQMKFFHMKFLTLRSWTWWKASTLTHLVKQLVNTSMQNHWTGVVGSLSKISIPHFINGHGEMIGMSRFGGKCETCAKHWQLSHCRTQEMESNLMVGQYQLVVKAQLTMTSRSIPVILVCDQVKQLWCCMRKSMKLKRRSGRRSVLICTL